MDNILFDIRGDKGQFKAAMDYIKSIAPGGKAVRYAIVPTKGLVLFWHEQDDKIVKLDFPYITDPKWNKDTAKSFNVELKKFDIPWEKFVEAWVFSTDPTQFELDEWERDLEDFDGSTGNGFRITCDTWGHVGGNHYAFAIIKPIFAWYGK
jgi:hypothetical protein